MTKHTPFRKIGINSIDTNSVKFNSDYNFIFILNGSLRIQTPDTTYLLKANDIILLEPQTNYIIFNRDLNNFIDIEIDKNFLLNEYPDINGLYLCNSILNSDIDYTSLRTILSQIVHVYFKNEPFTNINLMSLAYQLIYVLNSKHFKNSTSITTKYSDRINRIMSFINLYYSSNITLKDLADYLHLSTSYLSLFFKENLKSNFNNYLNRVRLFHTVNDLIYTNKTITDIASNNGFTNINTFYKLFAQEYGTTPSHYRKVNKTANTEFDNKLIEQGFINNMPLLESYIKYEHNITETILFPDHINVDNTNLFNEIKPIWNSMINLGSSEYLIKKPILKQLDFTQKDIGFRYARIECMFHKNFILIKNDKSYNFKYFDQVINSLLDSNIIPYLDLSFSLSVIKNRNTDDRNDYLNLARSLILHILNTFSIKNIEKWIFEISYDHENESVDSFVKRFDDTYRLIKHYIPNAKVGGINYHVIFSYTDLEEILQRFVKNNINPDFVSLYIFPYETSMNHEFYTTDISFAYHKVVAAKNVINNFTNLTFELYINALGIDIGNRNFINDTTFQAAFFVKNTIDLIGEVDLLGYYQLSDYSFWFNQGEEFLNGFNGLVNQFDIKKPGYLALQLIKNNGYNLIQKGNDYMITKGYQNDFYITICYYTHILDTNCLNLNEKINIQNAYSIYQDAKPRNSKIHLENLEIGNYNIITYRINRDSGSIIDEWARIDFWEPVTRRELNYLSNIVQPKQCYKKYYCEEGVIEFELLIQPNEFVFIELSLELSLEL